MWNQIQVCTFWPSFHVSSSLVFQHPISLDRNNFSTFSCFLFGYVACCVNHYNYSKSVVENLLEKLWEDESGRRERWLIAWRKCVNTWFYCCLGKYNKQTRGKLCSLSDKPFFSCLLFKIAAGVIWQKVLDPEFPGRRNIWKVDMESEPFFRSAITPDLFEIFLESLATAAVCLPGRRRDFRLARRP